MVLFGLVDIRSIARSLNAGRGEVSEAGRSAVYCKEMPSFVLERVITNIEDIVAKFRLSTCRLKAGPNRNDNATHMS